MFFFHFFCSERSILKRLLILLLFSVHFQSKSSGKDIARKTKLPSLLSSEELQRIVPRICNRWNCIYIRLFGTCNTGSNSLRVLYHHHYWISINPLPCRLSLRSYLVYLHSVAGNVSGRNPWDQPWIAGSRADPDLLVRVRSAVRCPVYQPVRIIETFTYGKGAGE